jgi:hypothetical protein
MIAVYDFSEKTTLLSKLAENWSAISPESGWRWRSACLDLMLSKFPVWKSRSYVELLACVRLIAAIQSTDLPVGATWT